MPMALSAPLLPLDLPFALAVAMATYESLGNELTRLLVGLGVGCGGSSASGSSSFPSPSSAMAALEEIASSAAGAPMDSAAGAS